MSLLASYLLAAAGSQVGGWDLSNARYNGTPINFFNVLPQEATANDAFFKPDGTKMYIIGSTGDKVNEYNLTTAWDISTASYSQNFSVVTQESSPQGLFFKSDGSKMYVIGNSGDDVNEYHLSTDWDISTASYYQSVTVAGQETSPTGLFFKPDGTKMYVIGYVGDDVNEYNLSTAWDISTISYSQTSSVQLQDTVPNGVFFKSDGTKMYVVGSKNDNVYEYSLSTAWSVTSKSYVGSFNVGTQAVNPQGVFFKSDGTKMYITCSSRDKVFSYDLSTAWDISTASFSYPSTDYYKLDTISLPTDLFFKPDGTKVYFCNRSVDQVYEYNLSTTWDISTASYNQSFSVNAQEANPTGLFFKPDGTKMYIVGYSGDDVNEYNLFTAWDISTAYYLQNFSIAVQESVPSGISFKSDGTKMYIVGYSGDDVNEYDLSTAWDISTASYSQNFSVSAQDTDPFGLFFKPDGTKMYILGFVGDDVNEYDLSTAWDVSTASYVQNFSVASELINPEGLFFKPDGTKMYVVGATTQAVWSYDL